MFRAIIMMNGSSELHAWNLSGVWTSSKVPSLMTKYKCKSVMSEKSSYLHHFLDDFITLFTFKKPIDVCSQIIVTMFIISQVSRSTCHTCLLNVTECVFSQHHDCCLDGIMQGCTPRHIRLEPSIKHPLWPHKTWKIIKIFNWE